MSTSEKTEFIQKAKLAEQAERYEDMVSYMQKAVEVGDELSFEERNLLSIAFKNLVGARRTSWRVISSIEKDLENNDKKSQIAKEYKFEIEKEIRDVCGSVLGMLDKYLVPKANGSEVKVYYLKMRGDYYRYLGEVSNSSIKDNELADREHVVNQSMQSYQDALDIAEKEVKASSALRLGLSLNFSVFYYEIMNLPEKACTLAKQAFDGALAELDTLTDDSYKDCTLIMQLLRDNLTLWNGECSGNDDEDDNRQQ